MDYAISTVLNATRYLKPYQIDFSIHNLLHLLLSCCIGCCVSSILSQPSTFILDFNSSFALGNFNPSLLIFTLSIFCLFFSRVPSLLLINVFKIFSYCIPLLLSFKKWSYYFPFLISSSFPNPVAVFIIIKFSEHVPDHGLINPYILQCYYYDLVVCPYTLFGFSWSFLFLFGLICVSFFILKFSQAMTLLTFPEWSQGFSCYL